MNYSTLRGASYILVHTPDMIEHNGTTQTTEKITTPDSPYLANLYDHCAVLMKWSIMHRIRHLSET